MLHKVCAQVLRKLADEYLDGFRVSWSNAHEKFELLQKAHARLSRVARFCNRNRVNASDHSKALYTRITGERAGSVQQDFNKAKSHLDAAEAEISKWASPKRGVAQDDQLVHNKIRCACIHLSNIEKSLRDAQVILDFGDPDDFTSWQRSYARCDRIKRDFETIRGVFRNCCDDHLKAIREVPEFHALYLRIIADGDGLHSQIGKAFNLLDLAENEFAAWAATTPSDNQKFHGHLRSCLKLMDDMELALQESKAMPGFDNAENGA